MTQPMLLIRIDDPLNSILQKCFQRDLSKRHQSAEELLEELEHYIYDQGYGPTNETLGRFIRELFGQNSPVVVDHSRGGTVVLDRTAHMASKNL